MPLEDVPRSFIKNVALQITGDYKLDNAPYPDEEKGQEIIPFIGRKRSIEKFLEFLNGNQKKGVFLVTGYKGMGKTSFVNYVVNQYRTFDRDGRKREAKNEASKIIPIHLTLTQNNPKEIDILRLLVSSVYEKYNVYRYRTRWQKILHSSAKTWLYFTKLSFFLVIFLTAAATLYNLKNHSDCFNGGDAFSIKSLKILVDLIPLWLAIILCGIYAILILIKLFVLREEKSDSPYNRIKQLMERCYSALSEESTNEEDFSIASIRAKFGGNEKRTKRYPIAETKEIEFELQQFLKKINEKSASSNEKSLEFIFIFDELDKIDSIPSPSYLYDSAETNENKRSEPSYERELRERKQAIVNIIAGLKNFFTTAPARFVFIAGREMFDASLADVADRQSSISSMFTYIFNIESLLKEIELEEKADKKVLNRSSLSNAVELYLRELLFAGARETTSYKAPAYNESGSLYDKAAKTYFGDNWRSLETPRTQEESQILGKLFFTLQNFVTFLAYRSNGSPQKLIKIIHEFILVEELSKVSDGQTQNDENEQSELFFALQNFVRRLGLRANGTRPKPWQSKLLFALQNLTRRLGLQANGTRQEPIQEGLGDTNPIQNNIIFQKAGSHSNLYLHFNYENQYRIAFINYLFSPFIIKRGGTLKVLSDNIVVATPYLFDHLLKFHPFAFSSENLETIPEVLSTNKTPFLRKHIGMIIDHLAASHIRETEISLFEYKFYSRTINEIAYLSKIFEPEAAAFNFTLDESHLVKLHIANKIKGLRSIYNKFLGESDVDYQIFSISHLSQILGDLHFFDQEYDDAITAYSDGIKALGRVAVGEKMEVRDFIALIKNKLKMGLCYEKTNSYEEALGIYADCCNDARRFMVGRLIKGRPFDIEDLKIYHYKKNNNDKEFRDTVFYSSGLSNLLQMILQGYLAEIFMQEKIGMEGISNLKLSIAIGSFLKMFDGFLNPTGRNHLLKANVYMFIGKLWYFKNNQVEFDLDNQMNDDKKILPSGFLNQIQQIISFNKKCVKNNPVIKSKKLAILQPVSALSFYLLSLYEVTSAKYDANKSDFVNIFSGFGNNNPPPADINLIKLAINGATNRLNNKNSPFRAVHYRYIGTLLSNIGDCLFSICKYGEKHYDHFSIDDLFQNLKQNFSEERLNEEGLCLFLKGDRQRPFGLTDVLTCYYLSGRCFLKLGRKISCSFQYNKILHVLRIVLDRNPKLAPGTEELFLKMLEKIIVAPLLQIASETSSSIDIHVTKKAESYGVAHSFALNNISYHPESREPVLLYNYIKLKIGVSIDGMHVNTLISPYNSISTQYSRMIELDFYAKYCETQIANCQDPASVIADCLFTRFTMIRLLQIYGANYAIGHRYLAYTHYRIGFILTKYENITGDPNGRVNQRLNYLFGYKAQTSVSPVYHFQKAKEFYEKMNQMHTGGREYRRMMTDMVYLEDDFNDNAYHFGAALDRYFIVNGAVDKWLEDCDKEIKASNSYSADAYLM